MANRDSADLKEIPDIKEILVQVFFSKLCDIFQKKLFCRITLNDCLWTVLQKLIRLFL